MPGDATREADGPRADGVARPGLLLFYALTALTFVTDNALLTGILWLALKLTGSPLLLGCVLCLSVVVSSLLSWAFGDAFQKISAGKLALIRAVTFGAIIGCVMLGVDGNPAGFLAVALLVGMADYFTVNCLETENAKRVVAGEIASRNASRVMQTAIQTGSFLGALLGGLLVERLATDRFIMTLALLAALPCIPLVLLHVRRRGLARAGSFAVGAERPQPGSRRLSRVDHSFIPLLLCLGTIGAQIGTYNVVVPIVFQQLNHWDATSFGLTDGLVGAGSLLVAILPAIPAHRIVFPLLIVTANLVIGFGHYMPFAAAAAFLAGFAVNHVRISVRSRLTDLARTDADAELIGSRGAFAFLIFQASTPLVCAGLTSPGVLGYGSAPEIFMLCGLSVVAAAMAVPRHSPLAVVAPSPGAAQ